MLGTLRKSEDYDRSNDDYIIDIDDNGNSGSIEFDDGTIDNFSIYDDGSIHFDNWYSEEKYSKLVDDINLKL
jgi:hypothetical protein